MSLLPGIPRTFVEFGVESYAEANTRFLVVNRGWRGLVMDGSAENMARLREDPIHWRHDIVAVDAFVTAANIDALIEANGFSGEIGILSLDIDGNDYWVLEAIAGVDPAILVVEFNAIGGTCTISRSPTIPASSGSRAILRASITAPPSAPCAGSPAPRAIGSSAPARRA